MGKAVEAMTKPELVEHIASNGLSALSRSALLAKYRGELIRIAKGN